jgi:26S proteasome regulatory subunit N9
MADAEASPVLEAQRKARPELGEAIDRLQQYANANLYHQLTKELLQYLGSPHFAPSNAGAADELKAFFDGFILPYEKKVDKVMWVRFLAIVCKPQQAQAALDLIAPFEASIEGDRDATYLWKSLKAEKLTLAGKVDKAKELLEGLGNEIENAYEVHATIRASYHKTNALMWKHLGRMQDFFQQSILYLTYTPLKDIPKEEQPQLAFEVSVAALAAEEEFEFGELLTQDVLTSIDGTPQAWVKDFVKAFGEGKFDMFDEALAKHAAQIAATPELKGAMDTVLRPKMAALALVELAFRKPKKQRRLTFEEVAQHCRLDIKQVEHLIMKSMCAGLIKGQIDEVNQLLIITWVKPRILDEARIDLMRERMDAWAAQTGLLLDHLEEMTPELLVS